MKWWVSVVLGLIVFYFFSTLIYLIYNRLVPHSSTGFFGGGFFGISQAVVISFLIASLLVYIKASTKKLLALIIFTTLINTQVALLLGAGYIALIPPLAIIFQIGAFSLPL